MNNKVELFLERIKKLDTFGRVKFVFLFGSYSEGKESKLSDIDFAVYYEDRKEERLHFRKKLLSVLSDNFDVQIFQDLPLFIRIQVLKGRLIYFKDRLFVYDMAYETIKKFEDFKKYYQDYINKTNIFK